MEHRLPRDPVKELISIGQVWAIAVKVLRLWTVPSPEGHRVKMILSDQERSRIGATINAADVPHFDGEFVEGEWRFLFGFRVIPSVDVPKLSKHKYEIVLKRTTHVRPLDPVLNDIYLDLPKLEHIWNGKVDTSVLSDLIGYVSCIGYLQNNQAAFEDEEPYILTFGLTNENNNEIYCNAVESIARRIYEQWEAEGGHGAVCILRFWKFEEETGPYYSSTVARSVAGCSDFMFNPPIREAIDFRKKFMLEKDNGSVIDP